MKFKVFYKCQNRYLTDYELEENAVYEIKDYIEGDLETFDGYYLFSFRVNLATGMIQTDTDNSCSDEECCTPSEMWCDDNDFIIEVI